MRRILSWLQKHWFKALGYLLATAVVSLLLFFRLGTLVPGLSASEADHLQNSAKAQTILERPLYAPHRLATYGLIKLKHTSPTALRALSAALGLISIVIMYLLLKQLHTDRIAAFGTILYLTSSWFMHIARLATPLMLIPLVTVATIFILQKIRTAKKAPRLWWWLLTVLFGLSFYVPGMFWVMLLLTLLSVRILEEKWLQVRVGTALAALGTFMVLIAPITYSAVRHPKLVFEIFMLPDMVPDAMVFLRSLGRLPLAFFLQSTSDPALHLGLLPFLDLFSFVMVLLGIYYYCRSAKIWSLIGHLIVFVIAAAYLALLPQSMAAVFVLIPMYLLIAAGMRVLLQQWFTVFPHNPLARTTGVVMVTILIGLAAFYHFNRYFLAWPNAPETRAVYNQTKVTQ